MTSTFPTLLNVQTVDILQRFDKHVSKYYESSYVRFEKLRFYKGIYKYFYVNISCRRVSTIASWLTFQQ